MGLSMGNRRVGKAKHLSGIEKNNSSRDRTHSKKGLRGGGGDRLNSNKVPRKN